MELRRIWGSRNVQSHDYIYGDMTKQITASSHVPTRNVGRALQARKTISNSTRREKKVQKNVSLSEHSHLLRLPHERRQVRRVALQKIHDNALRVPNDLHAAGAEWQNAARAGAGAGARDWLCKNAGHDLSLVAPPLWETGQRRRDSGEQLRRSYRLFYKMG